MLKHEYMTFEDFIGRVRYGTPLIIVDEEQVDREIFNGVYSFDTDIPELVGDQILNAEVTMITVKGKTLEIRVVYQDEEEDTGDDFDNS